MTKKKLACHRYLHDLKTPQYETPPVPLLKHSYLLKEKRPFRHTKAGTPRRYHSITITTTRPILPLPNRKDHPRL